MLLHALLRKTLRTGRLEVVYAERSNENYGDGSGPPVAVRLTRAGASLIAIDPRLGLGEAYMDDDLVLERGDLWELLAMAARNLLIRPKNSLQRRVLQTNDRAAARPNVAHHYDLSSDLYRRLLDADMQ
jgi:cyclopropane-fatty-acyl-phospholipid synthase